MKTEITEKERKAIKEASKKCQLSAEIYDFPSAFRKGAEFALSELRKPSESEPINQSELGDDLCKYCNRDENKKGVYGVDGCYCAGCEGSDCDSAYENYLDHFDSEPIGRTDEELVQKIEEIIRSCWTSEMGFNRTAKEIAKFISPRCQEYDVNVELLEAAKYFRHEWFSGTLLWRSNKSETDKHIDSITNAEKQMNP